MSMRGRLICERMIKQKRVSRLVKLRRRKKKKKPLRAKWRKLKVRVKR